MAFQKYATLPQFRRGATPRLHRTRFNPSHEYWSSQPIIPTMLEKRYIFATPNQINIDKHR
jgi:hypothetical protein